MGAMVEDPRKTVESPDQEGGDIIEGMGDFDINPYAADIKYDRLPSVALSTCLEEEEPDEVDDDQITGADAACRVGAIISLATDEYAGEKDAQDADASATRGQARSQARSAGRSGTEKAAQRGAEIARLLAQPRQAAELREYAAKQDFWRVPAFLRETQADFHEEEEYIASLNEPREAPKRPVRLLAQGEKELLIQGLKQQFQRATASYLKAAPKSRSRAELEEELERIKQDIDNLSRPYIFVEAESSETPE
eukprot:TRINITY_DN92627_c0_g1_i1.p1 TRINITY_DN92627_c0_g1~~TRINITY_DN92627_c0_g1_i1.p1  ORF type:complete len:252 (-),score=70.70 TRINITY_DN92627_c0_g1_i1:13-768(-)